MGANGPRTITIYATPSGKAPSRTVYITQVTCKLREESATGIVELTRPLAHAGQWPSLVDRGSTECNVSFNSSFSLYDLRYCVKRECRDSSEWFPLTSHAPRGSSVKCEPADGRNRP